MATEFTPGPWAYSAYAGHHDYGVYSEAPSERGGDVALVRDFNEANARLITAAPEMHAKLVRLSEYLSTLRHLGAITGPTIDQEIYEINNLLVEVHSGH